MSQTTQLRLAARDAVNRALLQNPIRADSEITLSFLREAMVLAFIEGANHAADEMAAE
jgi:hypothetical protein